MPAAESVHITVCSSQNDGKQTPGLIRGCRIIVNSRVDEGLAIATGLKKAREYFEEHPEEKDE